VALGRSAAVVIGSFPLAESDVLVTFFTRQHGKLHGVARRARRMRSRFGGALETFTLGELIFFDGGRSDLVQVDHFDIVRPFARLREDLERLGQAAWVVECAGRLTAERDPHPVVYGLLVRALGSIDAGEPPARTAVAFGVRCVDALGHRLRIDRCVMCGGSPGDPGAGAALDVTGGGALCPRCAAATPGALGLSAAGLRALRRLRVSSWAEATATPLGAAEGELRRVLEAHLTYLSGRPPRAARFLRDVARLSPDAGRRDAGRLSPEAGRDAARLAPDAGR
jgi:DNA repair protein RecO (recombination protein O)